MDAREILKKGGFSVDRGCDACGGLVTEKSTYCLRCLCGITTVYSRSDFDALFMDFLNMLSACGVGKYGGLLKGPG